MPHRPPVPNSTGDCSPSPARRAFLRLALALGGAAASGAAWRALAQTPNAPRTLDVVVVGAGMAGLCAAYELERRGHRVTLLEADATHVGGRVRTLRFSDGLHAEAGAMRVPAKHAVVRRYLAEFEVPLRRFVQSNPRAWYHVRGERHRIADVKQVAALYRLQDGERDRTPDALWEASVGKALQSLSEAERQELRAPAPVSPRVRALDDQSLEQLLRGAGLSDEAIEYVVVTSGAEALLPSAATEHLREELEAVWTQGFDEVVGGTDRLASAFAARLKSRPRTGCEVTRITQPAGRRRATVAYRERGADREVQGDFVLVTAPCPVLARMQFEPGLSGPKARAVRELGYDSATKVIFQVARRFWEQDDGIFGGGTYTDLPTGTTWYPSDNAEARDRRVSASSAAFLASYTWGQAARRMASLAHAQRTETVMQHLARVHPQLERDAMVRHSASWSWDNHPHAGGAFAWFLPGQHGALHRHLLAPEGRVHFAGEHASLVHTWIEGALESSLRAVREMLEAARRD